MDNEYTHITIILDRTGSMESIRDDTIGGFNAFLGEQKKQPGDATLSLVLFNYEYKLVYDNVNIAKVPALNEKTARAGVRSPGRRPPQLPLRTLPREPVGLRGLGRRSAAVGCPRRGRRHRGLQRQGRQRCSRQLRL